MNPAPLRLGLHLERGMRVGLFGGSFNPPHEGHLHVARTARRALGLDRVIWLVSPGNPLKDKAEAAPMARRLALTRALARGPSMIVSDLEARLGSPYTIDTLRALKRRFPGVRFFWIMGSDNLAGFRRWRNWRAIARTVPIAVVDRPGSTVRARLSPAARRFGFRALHGRLNFTSSTALRGRAKEGLSEAAQGVVN